MTATPIVFLDTETLGLELDDPIWELALIRRETDGNEVEHHFFVQHVRDVPASLPEAFAIDYETRYDPDAAWDRNELRPVLRHLLRDRPHVVGAVPNFDTERIAHQLHIDGWHYHLIDVENLAVGYLAGQRETVPALPWDSNALSRRLGINPDGFVRHTALDDARWARAIWDRITTPTMPATQPKED